MTPEEQKALLMEVVRVAPARWECRCEEFTGGASIEYAHPSCTRPFYRNLSLVDDDDSSSAIILMLDAIERTGCKTTLGTFDHNESPWGYACSVDHRKEGPEFVFESGKTRAEAVAKAFVNVFSQAPNSTEQPNKTSEGKPPTRNEQKEGESK